MKEIFMVHRHAGLHGETGNRKASYKVIFKENKNEQKKPELGCSQLELKCKTNCRPFEKNGLFSVSMGHEEMSVSILVVCDPSNFSDQVACGIGSMTRHVVEIIPVLGNYYGPFCRPIRFHFHFLSSWIANCISHLYFLLLTPSGRPYQIFLLGL